MKKEHRIPPILLAASTLCASTNASNPCQCLEQGLGLDSAPKCYTAAYNAPAAISIKNGWDFNAFASFIYWHVSQEAMTTASIISFNEPSINTTQARALPSFEYQPGFKIGLGFDTNYDDWTSWIEYTWLHQSTSHTNTASTDNPFRSSPWFISWIQTLSIPSQPYITSLLLNSITEIHSEWKMHLDQLDAAFSRPFYQGSQITISPYAGLRALWIRQNLNLTFPNRPNIMLPPEPLISLSKNQSHSWAIGPMLGTLGHSMLGMGFRFEGKAGASLLYTQYTKIKNHQEVLYPIDNTGDIGSASNTSCTHNENTLRPTAELGLGLGWGSYLDNQNYYFDFSARYDFNILWNQNMMINFVNSINGIEGTSGNLYLHGLTLSSRFDF